jgi:predicted mannosyl-3-phosphoglycerate phosphatase (HAD superfamily)
MIKILFSDLDGTLLEKPQPGKHGGRLGRRAPFAQRPYP